MIRQQVDGVEVPAFVPSADGLCMINSSGAGYGAVAIGPRWALSAGHVVRDTVEGKVATITQGAVERAIGRSVRHGVYDLALIKIADGEPNFSAWHRMATSGVSELDTVALASSGYNGVLGSDWRLNTPNSQSKWGTAVVVASIPSVTDSELTWYCLFAPAGSASGHWANLGYADAGYADRGLADRGHPGINYSTPNNIVGVNHDSGGGVFKIGPGSVCTLIAVILGAGGNGWNLITNTVTNESEYPYNYTHGSPLIAAQLAWIESLIGGSPNAPGMARGRGSVRGVMQERARG